MPNKNNKSDLWQFFGAMAAIIFCLGWFLSWGWARAEKEYGDDIEKIDVQITEFLQEKWRQATR